VPDIPGFWRERNATAPACRLMISRLIQRLKLPGRQASTSRQSLANSDLLFFDSNGNPIVIDNSVTTSPTKETFPTNQTLSADGSSVARKWHWAGSYSRGTLPAL
jgi:hypothetical protein